MSMTDSKKGALVASAVLMTTFLLGVATGVGGAWWTRGAFPWRPPHGPIPFEQLDLSTRQQAQVREIFERYHPQFDAVFRSTFPQVQAISQKLEAEVREVLDDRQKARLDALSAKRPPFPPPTGPWETPPRAPPSADEMQLPPRED